MLNTKLATAVKLALTVGAVSTAVFSGNVFANEAGNEEVERIQVTGSKIKRIAATAPTPVIVIGRADLEDAGVSNVNDFLADIPSAVVGLSPETTNNYVFANGLNTTNLRGLGSARTLVLVNGRRFIGGQPGRGQVDLNNIATSMVERIEVSTGGASAVYGADAVSGVVNIITRKSFDGLEIDYATTRPFEGGGEQNFGSLIFGKEFNDGGFIFGYDFADQKQMARKDKSWYYDNPIITFANPDDRTGDDGIPRSIQASGKRHLHFYDTASDFVVGGQRYTFDENRDVREFQTGEYVPQGGLPGSRSPFYYLGDFKDGVAFADDEFFRTPLTRHTFNVAGNLNLDDNHKLTFDMVYAINEAEGQGSPTFFRAPDTSISIDNAYVKDDLRTLMEENGVTSININRTAKGFGERKYNQDRSTFRASIGLEGDINDNWYYSTYFQHGRIQQDTSWFGEVLTDRVYEALDAVYWDGEIVCANRDSEGEVVGGIAGCSPISFLGEANHSQEALDYITTIGTSEQGGTQTSFAASVGGDLFELPAGPVSTAFTAEWRRETGYESPGTGMRKGLIFGNTSLPYDGNVTVKEYSTEVLVPLLAEHEFAQELNLEVAYRHMDYSSTGTDSAYKLGFSYQLNDDWRFRLTKAESVRAPSVNDLYSSAGTQYANRDETCAADSIASHNEDYRDNVIKNCQADNIPVGWTPSSDWRNGSGLEGKLGGNPDLQNEVSKDITFGFIYTPQSIEGFDITVDYWKFEIDNAIRFYDYETAMLNCYRSDSLDNPFCGMFTRDPETRDVVDYYETSINLATEEKSGVDIESVYKLGTDLGDFVFKFTGTYVEKYELNQTGNPIDVAEYTGSEDHVRWRGVFETSYSYEDLRLTWKANYRHGSVGSTTWTPERTDYNEIPSYTVHDFNATYNLNDNVQLRLGIQNVFDNTPPRNPYTFSNTNAYYDSIGRRATAGIKIRL